MIDQVPEGNQEIAYYGEPNILQEHCVDAKICPDLVLALIAAAGAFGLLMMYMAATQNANGRKKRRRSLDGYAPSPSATVPDMILVGNNSMIFSSQLLACIFCTTGWQICLLLMGCFHAIQCL